MIVLEKILQHPVRDIRAMLGVTSRSLFKNVLVRLIHVGFFVRLY